MINLYKSYNIKNVKLINNPKFLKKYNKTEELVNKRRMYILLEVVKICT